MSLFLKKSLSIAEIILVIELQSNMQEDQILMEWKTYEVFNIVQNRRSIPNSGYRIPFPNMFKKQYSIFTCVRIEESNY
jgi:hypothetical protein